MHPFDSAGIITVDAAGRDDDMRRHAVCVERAGIRGWIGRVEIWIRPFIVHNHFDEHCCKILPYGYVTIPSSVISKLVFTNSPTLAV